MDSDIWKRVAIVLAILLVGGALGFGIGYRVGDSGGTKTAAKTTPAARRGAQGQKGAKAGNAKKRNPAQRAALVKCLSDHGVKYPNTTANLTKPPQGVDQKTYNDAVVACYKTKPTATTKP